MTALIPSETNDMFEDMFKEITRKLYGDDASHSLHTPTTSVPNSISDRSNLISTDFDHSAGIFVESPLKNDNDNLAAFGLALMHNTFTSPNSILSSHKHSSPSNMNTISAPSNASHETGGHIKCITTVQHSDESNLWNPKPDAYQSQKIFKPKREIRDTSIPAINPNGNTSQASSSANVQSSFQKRYTCTSCPYSTDRRDLFTRHENIHKEDKPFHCYVCLKQFNRADHVKKHFLRMHRGLNYDIGRTKRQPQPKSKKQVNSSGLYYHNANNSHQDASLMDYHTSPHHQQQHMEHQAQASDIDRTNQQLNASNQINPGHQLSNVKVETNFEKSLKKCDKRFICCYCSWSGNDNWGLKRHLNTHTKPFVCVLCDYKAARSERLATHIFKVHNKKVCTKCNYLAENQNEYDAHVTDVHANETRSQRTGRCSYSTDPPAMAQNISKNLSSSYNGTNSFNTMQSGGVTSGQSLSKSCESNQNTAKMRANQKRGADRLFQYFGADDSDPEDYNRQLHMAAISRNTSTVAQDFHNAGGGKEKGAAEHGNSAAETKQLMDVPYLCNRNEHISLNKISENILKTFRSSVSPPAKIMTQFENQNHRSTGNLLDHILLRRAAGQIMKTSIYWTGLI